ncbi:HlyD family type I secretion periplasmic adaptor subunit [Zooshikella ganghwensis]|nr:HlyD family type I secretion periplasmic adaptor subunit [Zooshikella ganghwensis]
MEKGLSTTLAHVIDEHSRQQAHWLADPLLKEEGGQAWIYLSLWGIFLAVLIVIVGGMVWPVDQRVVATGSVVVQGDIRAVQLFEGGHIASVLVSTGQLVESGQALLVMDSAKDQLELKKLKSHHERLLQQEKVYRTLLTGQLIGGFENPKEQAAMDAEMRIYYDQAKERYLAKLVPIKQQIATLSSTLQEEQVRLNELQVKKTKLQEAFEAKQVLLQKGYITRQQLNSAQQDLSEVALLFVQAEENILAGKKDLANIRLQFQQIKEEAKSQWTQQLTQVVTQQTKAVEHIEQVDQRIRQKVVKSPIRGVVQAIRNTQDSPVTAGGIVAEVVPLNQSLAVEVKVNMETMNTLQIGQEVRVAIDAFSVNNVDAVAGVVKSLINRNYVNEEGSSYQKAIIELATDFVGNQETRNKILPGMTVQASIQIGQQPLLSYLFNPLWQHRKQHKDV